MKVKSGFYLIQANGEWLLASQLCKLPNCDTAIYKIKLEMSRKVTEM